jgi:hypothetical protein
MFDQVNVDPSLCLEQDETMTALAYIEAYLKSL